MSCCPRAKLQSAPQVATDPVPLPGATLTLRCTESCCCVRRPLYLIMNLSGRDYPRWASHFDPYSPIYSRRERLFVVVSDLALTVMLSGLCSLAMSHGWLWLTKARQPAPCASVGLLHSTVILNCQKLRQALAARYRSADTLLW